MNEVRRFDKDKLLPQKSRRKRDGRIDCEGGPDKLEREAGGQCE